jgi:glycosyltransferase involved in cell wall biosynthesis
LKSSIIRREGQALHGSDVLDCHGVAQPSGPAPVPGLISVIIPTFNRAEFLIGALNSVAAQSWRSIEIVVVDDGSTDGTAGLVESWVHAHPDLSVQLFCQSNRGVSAARNVGAAAARGEFLYFLDSDDLIAPKALETLIAPLLHGEAPFSLAHIRNVDLGGEPAGDPSQGISVQSPDYFASHWMTHAALYRRSTFSAAGPFEEKLRRGEDTQHQWRVIATAGPGAVVDKYIGLRRIHDRGHLCIGRNPAASARDDLAAVRYFLEWADRASPNPADRQVPVARLILAAIRAGARRDWMCHDEALSLLGRFETRPSKVVELARTVLSRQSLLIHLPLAILLRCARGIRFLPEPMQRKPREITDL